MPKISENKLIEQIKRLKEIKPRKEWVILTKSELFNETKEQETFKIPAQRIRIWNLLQVSNLRFFASKQLAYSFVAVIFIFVGLIGFANNTVPGDLLFPIKKITEQSTAALNGETILKQNLTTLNHRINDLARVSKNGETSKIPFVMSEVNENASALAESLKKELITDPATINEIAINLKTLASVAGEDLIENSGMKVLYKTVVESQIADMEKSTLTEKQIVILEEVKKLYEEEKYYNALELILNGQSNEQINENNEVINKDEDTENLENKIIEIKNKEENNIEKTN